MSGLPSLYPDKDEESEWEADIEWYRKQYEESCQEPDAPLPKTPRVSDTTAIVIGKIDETLKKKDFKEKCGITRDKLYEGGSVKQGTVVHGHYDVDLVLFSQDLKPDSCISHDGYEQELKKIDEHFQKVFVDDDRYVYRRIDRQKVTLVFDVYIYKKSHKITVKLSLSHQWKTIEDLFTTLGTTDLQEKRELFIPSTIILQTDYIRFVEDRDHWRCQHIHDLIQRAKAWKISNWPKDKKEQAPDSYLLSLLVIEAYRKVEPKKPKKLKTYADGVTEEFIRLVKKLAMKEDRDELTKSSDIELQNIRAQYSHLLPASLRWLIDPANPANNVYVSGMSGEDKVKGWEIFAKKVNSIDLKLSVETILKE